MSRPRFVLNPVGVLTLLNQCRANYYERLFALPIESEPMAVPIMLHIVFPGTFAPSHELLIQYTAITDYIRQIFTLSDFLGPLTENESAVRATLRPIFMHMISDLESALAAQEAESSMTSASCVAAFETFLLQSSDLLAIARAMVAKQRCPLMRMEYAPFKPAPVPLEEQLKLEEACAKYNMDRRVFFALRESDEGFSEEVSMLTQQEDAGENVRENGGDADDELAGRMGAQTLS